MRLRDNPTTEVTRRLACTPERAWELVTDIALPTRADGELQRVEWLDGATEVAVGNRFRGYNASEALGEWQSIAVITDVEPGRRWVWAVSADGGEPWAHWGFEVDPASDGCVVRQWGRVGDADSGLTAFVAAAPEKEGRLVDGRLKVWRVGMESNLDVIAAAVS